MSVRIWNKIATLTPTRDAAVALSGGDSYEPRPAPQGELHSDLPLPFRAPTRLELNTTMTDLTGQRFGRLLVLGISTEKRRNAARWVCRCDCGRYTGRRAARLLRAANARCAECDWAQHLRWKSSRPDSLGEQAARLDALITQDKTL